MKKLPKLLIMYITIKPTKFCVTLKSFGDLPFPCYPDPSGPPRAHEHVLLISNVSYRFWVRPKPFNAHLFISSDNGPTGLPQQKLIR